MEGKTLISIVGPTAIGKTALSIKLANYFKTEIISADSRQFYKEMNIGTAVPDKEELESAKHHFIEHISIQDKYSVGAFEKEAINRLNSLFETYDVVIMVGGSGLYVDAVTQGLDYFPEVAPEIRTQLNKQLETEGLETLQSQLKTLDPVSYSAMAIDNPHRVIRALEVCMGSGKPYSSFLNKDKGKRPFNIVTVGITADRPIIYERINKRVDIMLEAGLLNEVKALLPYKTNNALNTVGYKELFHYLEGDWTLEFAISEIKKNTRRFAKRQLTWFKRNTNTLWVDYECDFDEVVERVEKLAN